MEGLGVMRQLMPLMDTLEDREGEVLRGENRHEYPDSNSVNHYLCFVLADEQPERTRPASIDVVRGR